MLLWDAVNMHWERWVLGYGPNLQRALLELLGFELPGLRHSIALTVTALGVFAVLFSVVSLLAGRPRHTKDPAARAFERSVAKLGRAARGAARAERSADGLRRARRA